MRLIPLLVGFILILAASVAAQAPLSKLAVGAAARREVMVTVYNNNYGLIREVREVDLPDGLIELEYQDVAEKIDPTSVAVKPLDKPDAFSVLEQNYRYDLLSPQTLLEKFVGRSIEITTPRMKDNTEILESRTGTLLSTQGGTVVRFHDAYEINPQGSITLRNVPEELLSKPTLVWLLRSAKAGRLRMETSYLTHDLNWKSDYVAVVDAPEKQLDLTGWVTLENRSGATYAEARLKLIAGDVQRIVEPTPVQMARQARAMAAAAPEQQFAEKSFFEYHLYTLDRKTTLANNETKQMTLLEGREIGIKKNYIFDSTPWARSGGPNWAESQKAKVVVEFENKKENNLGMAMPAGRIRVYKADDDATLQLIGEDRIDHTPRDEKIRLTLGEAFDIVGERTMTNYQKISDKIGERAFEIVLRNHKDEDVMVTIVEHAFGDWTVTQESQRHRKVNARTLEFVAPVKSRGETRVTYTVRVEM
jgi:hypothetical protein